MPDAGLDYANAAKYHSIDAHEMGLNALPAGWVETSIGQLCRVNPRSFTNPVEDDCPISFVPMAAVEARTGRIDLSGVRLYREVRKGYTPFSEGDVLFAKITPCMENGKVAVARGLTNESGCGSTEFHVLRLPSCMPGDLLYYYLLQDEFRREAQRHMAGTAGQLRVPAAWLNEAPIPFPPLREQHRIVAEIETQFTRLDASVAALRRAQANLKRYRASVLKDACEGQLVSTEAELARSEGRDYEPAGVLLERILAERRARWESQEKRRGRYKEPTSLDTSGLLELPEGWAWASLDQIIYLLEGGTAVTATSNASSRKVLRSSAVRHGFIDLDDYRYLPDGAIKGSDPYILGGDLLFTRLSGTLEYVGNCAVVGELSGQRIEYPDRIFRGRCVSSVSPYYIQNCFSTQTLREDLARIHRWTA